MDIKQLQYFYTLCQRKNISITAGIHYISQQGLSASVKKLESELGVDLFTREGHGTYPNAYALEILPHVEELLESYDKIREISAKNKIQVSGAVEIAADLMLLDYIPHGTEAKLKQRFPDLIYHIYNTDDRSAMRDVLNDKVEIAIVSGPVDQHIFHSTELHRFPYVAIVNKEDSLHDKDSLHLEDLSGHDMILPSPEHNMNTNFRQQCKAKGVDPNIKFFASDSQHLMYLCSVEPAIGIISSFYSHYFVPRNFRIVPIDEPSLYWTIEVISAKNRQLTTPAICWRDHIIDASVQMKEETL